LVPGASAVSGALTPHLSHPSQNLVADAPAQKSNVPLEQLIADWVGKHNSNSAQWSVVVRQLDGGDQTSTYNASAQYDPASIYKLYATYAFAQKVPAERWATEHTLNGQGDHTYAQCIDAMLRLSDNPCGEAIGNQVGWANIDKAIHRAGFTTTTLNRSQGMLSTAADTASFLKQLEQGSLVTATVRDQILASLNGQRYRAGIPAGCDGCETFNKTGERDGFLHDAAIIHSGNHSYVLVIFSKGGTKSQIADLTSQINNFITAP